MKKWDVCVMLHPKFFYELSCFTTSKFCREDVIWREILFYKKDSLGIFLIPGEIWESHNSTEKLKATKEIIFIKLRIKVIHFVDQRNFKLFVPLYSHLRNLEWFEEIVKWTMNFILHVIFILNFLIELVICLAYDIKSSFAIQEKEQQNQKKFC